MPARQAVSQVDVQHVKQMVLGRLYGRVALPELVGLDDPFSAVYTLLKQTVSSNEGNSALVLGPRGSGKSAIIDRCLDLLKRQHGATSSAKYYVVRLNGFVHTNDRLALRDIARQLLITQDLEHILIGSFADAFTYILNLLRSNFEESGAVPPVVFVLEEFDLLAQHPKQSLLYTLFDIAQSHQTPIAVIGLTARIDVMDLLEKRVKSRFSHRQIYVRSVQTLEQFKRIAQIALQINTDHNVSAEYASEFNQKVDQLLASDSVVSYMEHLFDFGKDVRQLLQTLASSISQLSVASPFPQLAPLTACMEREMQSAKLQILANISVLELCLIIAMKSLVQLGSTKYNFEMVYDEYKTFMSRHMMAVAAGGAMKIYKKPVALKAFETLIELEIVRPLSSVEGGAAFGRNDLLAGTAAGNRVPKEYRMVQLMLEPGQVMELAADRPDIPAVIRRWAQQ
ncbi:origin recognition complex subunit 4 [Coemansia brasiliensis]|uniref:Origin recognition complex subunit 4 n=1 Tax=Coemansia brasiliensis TaxID=2650707 RepID=A0A9W8I7N8_9FUNG|nr:origin recognition complex subunit 4 [Coemansia brasiliensis]